MREAVQQVTMRGLSRHAAGCRWCRACLRPAASGRLAAGAHPSTAGLPHTLVSSSICRLGSSADGAVWAAASAC
jgi:hypothetical protein